MVDDKELRKLTLGRRKKNKIKGVVGIVNQPISSKLIVCALIPLVYGIDLGFLYFALLVSFLSAPLLRPPKKIKIKINGRITEKNGEKHKDLKK